MKISSASIAASMEVMTAIAKEYNIKVDTAVGVHLAVLKQTASERSDPETREAAKVLIHQLYQDNPYAEFDPKELAPRVGLKPVQSDKSFIRHVLRMLAIEHKKAPAE